MNRYEPEMYGQRSPVKRRSEVTMEDVANLDSLSIAADDPLSITAAKYVSSVFDIASFKPLKPLSRKATQDSHSPVRRPRTRRTLPFSQPSLPVLPTTIGVPAALTSYTYSELELDYYQSLLDEAGHFRKFEPLMECNTEVLMVEFRLQVVEGRIWRNFRMEAGTSFYTLRRAILDLMGWKEETSWAFIYISRENRICMLGQTGYLKDDDELRMEEQQVVIETLHESYCRFAFIYDLELRWKVDLILRKVMDREENAVLPVCVKGRGSLELGKVPSLKRLRKVVEVLRIHSHPKRGKYQDKYGDLLAPVHVISTSFPSFYSPTFTPEPEKRHRRKRGPFNIRWTPFPPPPSPAPPPLKIPVFLVSNCDFETPVLIPETETTQDESSLDLSHIEVNFKPRLRRFGRRKFVLPKVDIEDLPVKRNRKPAERYEPPIPIKRKRRPRSDSVLVINYPPV